MSSHALDLGDLSLIGADDFDYTIETIAEGMSFGGADPQDVVTQTLLQDGSAVTTDRWDNRSITFGVLIKGADLISVAAGEKALYAELGRRNTLTWTPPDGWGPPTVFDVLTSWAEFEFDDWGEMEPGTIGRRFLLRLTCLPWGRDVERTVVSAVATGGTPPTPSTVVVDTCSSASGWTGSGTVSSLGAYVQTTATVVAKDSFLQRAGTIDTSVTNFVQVDWFFTGVVKLVSATGDGVDLPLIAQVALDNGYTRATFEVAAPSISALRFSISHNAAVAGDRLRIDQVVRTNVSPFAGTGRQQFRALAVGGSARTQGSLQIAHDTSALGDVLVYTNADDQSGYQPACRQYRAAGGTVTPDTSTASGALSPLDGGTPETYDIPARALPPGTYTILARVKMRTGTATALLSATAATRGGGIDSTVRSVGRFAALTTAWSIVEIGRLTLPPTAVPAGSSSVVRLKLSTATAVDVDECWVFNVDIGALTWVRAGTGTPATFGASNRLWLDTATLDRPRPSVWLGTQADRSDARHALGITEVESSGTHIFPPGPVNLFTVTTNALNAAASLDYYRSWANNAGAA